MKIICKLREWLKIKPVHRMKRITRKTAIKHDGIQVGTASAKITECARCGITKPVKHRKAKVTESHEQLRVNLSGITDVMRGRKSREDV